MKKYFYILITIAMLVSIVGCKLPEGYKAKKAPSPFINMPNQGFPSAY